VRADGREIQNCELANAQGDGGIGQAELRGAPDLEGQVIFVKDDQLIKD